MLAGDGAAALTGYATACKASVSHHHPLLFYTFFPLYALNNAENPVYESEAV